MAITLDIPQRGIVVLQHAVFDVNGTLAVDGTIIPGVAERMKTLTNHLLIHLLTSGTHGNLTEIEQTLGFQIHMIHRGDEKMRYVQQLGPTNVIAFGNGVNDNSMLRLAAIGIAILTPEGTAMRALQAADALVYGPVNALDLLLKPNRLIATLRG
jgi:soluble P-type ATPase